MRASPGFCNDGTKAVTSEYILTSTTAVRDSPINPTYFSVNATPSAGKACSEAGESDPGGRYPEVPWGLQVGRTHFTRRLTYWPKPTQTYALQLLRP